MYVREAPNSDPPTTGLSSGIVENSGFKCTWGTRGLSSPENPLMIPYTSIFKALARTTAP